MLYLIGFDGYSYGGNRQKSRYSLDDRCQALIRGLALALKWQVIPLDDGNLDHLWQSQEIFRTRSYTLALVLDRKRFSLQHIQLCQKKLNRDPFELLSNFCKFI